MKGIQPEQPQDTKDNKKSAFVIPPMTTTNKAVVNKKVRDLRLISEEADEDHPVKIPTPMATKKSNKTPKSIKSSN